MERVMTVPETADYLRQSVYTIRNWIKCGKLRANRVGRGYLITEDAVRELVAAPQRPRLSVEESLKSMRLLQVEGARAGIGPQTYKKVMANVEAREAESRDEIGSILNGSGS